MERKKKKKEELAGFELSATKLMFALNNGGRRRRGEIEKNEFQTDTNVLDSTYTDWGISRELPPC